MNPKVSVIVPIYKVEDYLCLCVDSLLNQTLKDIEIILVDDGSPDNCGKIIDRYALEDNRIKVVHKENGGLSDARNSGLNIATGQYVSFVDSDDWLESTALEIIYGVAIDNDADVVVTGFIFEYVNENYNIKKTFDQLKVAKTDHDIKDGIYEMCENGLLSSVTNKIYKRGILLNNKICFDINAMPAEDIIFNTEVFSRTIQSLVLLNKAFYHYMKRDTETYVTRYSSEIYNITLTRYNSIKDLFCRLLLNELKHKRWLDTVYFTGLNDCVINMYRRGSTLNFKQRKTFIEEKILSDTYAQHLMLDYIPQNNYEKIFKTLFRLSNSLIMTLVYDTLFIIRRNFNNLYLRFRRKSLYGD